MATTKLNIIKDINGTVAYLLPQSNALFTAALTANVAQSVTAPTDAIAYGMVVGVSNGIDIYISVNGTATIPTGVFAPSNTAQNIAQRYVNAGDVISFLTPSSGATISVEFYAIQ